MASQNHVGRVLEDYARRYQRSSLLEGLEHLHVTDSELGLTLFHHGEWQPLGPGFLESDIQAFARVVTLGLGRVVASELKTVSPLQLQSHLPRGGAQERHGAGGRQCPERRCGGRLAGAVARGAHGKGNTGNQQPEGRHACQRTGGSSALSRPRLNLLIQNSARIAGGIPRRAAFPRESTLSPALFPDQELDVMFYIPSKTNPKSSKKCPVRVLPVTSWKKKSPHLPIVPLESCRPAFGP